MVGASSPEFQKLLAGLAAEHERSLARLRAEADGPMEPEQEDAPSLGWLMDAAGAAGSPDAASPGHDQAWARGKDEFAREVAEASSVTSEKPVRQQLLSATRKMAVKLASVALQQALHELEAVFDQGLLASNPQQRSAEASAAVVDWVREEKLDRNLGEAAQQAQRRADEADDTIKKAKLSAAVEPEPKHEGKAQPERPQGLLPRQPAEQHEDPEPKHELKAQPERSQGLPRKPAERREAEHERAEQEQKVAKPASRSVDAHKEKEDAASTVPDSKADHGKDAEAERAEYYRQVMDGKVKQPPAPGSVRPSEAESLAASALTEVVRHADADAFPGEASAVTLSVGHELSRERRVQLGVRYCREGGYGGFRLEGSRLHLLRQSPGEIEKAKRAFLGRTLVVVRRPQRRQSKYDLVSMGQFCATATFLTSAGWRTQAFPLDWSCHTLQVWDDMLADDFKLLLAEPGPGDDRFTHPYHKKYRDNALFLHQKGWANDNTRRRVERLRAALKRKRVFGLSVYFEGQKNVHATQQEVLSWAKLLAKPERGFQHIVLVWCQGKAKEPSGKWIEVSERLTLLRYTPTTEMHYKIPLDVEDVLCLSKLLEARFPHVFTGFDDSPVASARDSGGLSEEDIDGDEDVDDIWDFTQGRYRGLVSKSEEAKAQVVVPGAAPKVVKVTLGMKVVSGKDQRSASVIELPWMYSGKDFFMVRFDDTRHPAPRPLMNFRTADGRSLVVDRRFTAQVQEGMCGDCRHTKTKLLCTKAAGNAMYCAPCWCKEWWRWD